MRSILVGVAIATVLIIGGVGISRYVRSPVTHYKTVTVYKQAMYAPDRVSMRVMAGYPAPANLGVAASSEVRRVKAAKSWIDKGRLSVEGLGYPNPYWGTSWNNGATRFNIWSEDFSKNCALEAKFEITPKGQVVKAVIRRLTMRQFYAAPAENLTMPAYEPYGGETLKRLTKGCQPAT